MKYPQAKSIADNIVDLLRPHCDIINIAGSIRRLKAEVGDIEIVCLPKKIVLKNKMFGYDEGTMVEPLFDKLVNEFGVVIKGNTDGRYMQIELHNGIKLDLFMPSPHDYYRQYAIRTGSAEYSRLIANAWNDLGWVGTPDGLRLRHECVQLARSRWHCNVQNPTLPPVWQSEEDFFQWLGKEWIEPKFRNYE